MRLTYRMFQDDDFPGLQRLWEEATGWGGLTAEVWRRYRDEGPLGGMACAVAQEPASGKIVGQFAFLPSLVSVDGAVVRAFRPAAPIVGKEARWAGLNPLRHPIAMMYARAVRELRDRGDGLIYMVPDPRWLRFFRMFPNLVCGTFPLWKMPVPLAAPLPLPPGHTAAPLGALDGRVDRLWEAASRLHGCSVVRNAEALAWKTGDAEYDVLGIEHAGELVAVVTSRQKGDRQWLVCDVLFADPGEPLRAALAAACNLADRRARAAPPEKPIIKAAVLVTPVMEPAARALGLERDRYDFPMVIDVLSPRLTRQQVHPSRWYVSAND
jgi:hypothetical protein